MADSGNTVDNLQIEIEATSAEAEKRIESLTAVLERLKKATTGFGNVGEKIREIGESAESSAGATAKKRREALDRATKSLKPKPIDNDVSNQISAIDSQSKEVKEKIKELERYLSTFNPSSKAYSQMNEELEKQKSILDELIAKRKELAAVSINTEEPKQYKSQWDVVKSQFSGSTLGDILGNTGSIDEAVEKMMNLNDQVSLLNVKMEGLQEKLRGAFESGNQTQIANYTAQIQRLKEQLKDIQKDAGNAQDSDTDIVESEESLQEKMSIVQRIKSLVERLKPAQLTDTEQFIRSTSQLDVLKSKADGLKDSIRKALEEGDTGKATELVGQYQRVQEQIEKIGEKSKNLKSIFESLSSPIHNITNALKKIGGAGFSEIKKFGKSVASNFTEPFKNAIKTVEKWKSAIGRIAFYRAIRGAIKMITDGFREGTENLYQYSRIVGTEFAPAMDRLATSALYLKNSVGAIAAPLIQAVAPAVDMLVDKFVTLLNVIGKTFAALTGKSAYTQAKKHAVEYADAANSASKATQKFLLGIDELTILDQPSGGGGSEKEDYGSMFEEVEVPSEISDWTKKIRDAIEEGNWRGVGQILAGKLNDVVNGLDTYSWGKKLGENINKGLNAAYGFLTTFDFKNLGAKLAEGLNGIFDSVNWELLGRTLTAGFTASIDFLIGFLGTLNWASVGKAIGDGLRGAFDQFSEWVKTKDWSQMGHDLYTNVKLVIEEIDFASLAKSFFYALGSALGASVAFIGSFVGDVVQDIKDYFLQYIEDENGDGKFGGIEIIKGLLKGIWEGIKGIGAWIKENVFTPFIQGFKDAFGIHSPSTVMAEMGSYIVDGLLKGISDTWHNILDFFTKTMPEWWDNYISPWFTLEKWSGIVKNIGTSIENAWNDTVGEWGKNIKDWWDNDVSPWFSLSKWKELGKSALEGLFSGLSNIGGKIRTWGGNLISGVKDFFGIHSPSTLFRDQIGLNMGLGIASGISNSENNILASISGITNEISDVMSRTMGNIEPVQPRYSTHDNLIPAVRPFYAEGNTDTLSSYQQDNQYPDSSEVINAIFAMGQQIVNAINENGDRPINLDMGKVTSSVTTMQNRRNKMYGKQL